MHRIQFLKNISFETPAYILESVIQKGFNTVITDLSQHHILPDPHDFDTLIIMGGPMNVYETDRYHWLEQEKKLIESTLRLEKRIVGICLGAQLIADVMGAQVKKNPHKEIGWHEVRLKKEALSSPLLAGAPRKFTALHWHGDTFSIPHGAVRIGESNACRNQGFLYNESALALQFHLETTKGSLENLLTHCSEELIEEAYIQDADTIRSAADEHIGQNHELMDVLLGNLIQDGGNVPHR